MAGNEQRDAVSRAGPRHGAAVRAVPSECGPAESQDETRPGLPGRVLCPSMGEMSSRPGSGSGSAVQHPAQHPPGEVSEQERRAGQGDEAEAEPEAEAPCVVAGAGRVAVAQELDGGEERDAEGGRERENAEASDQDFDGPAAATRPVEKRTGAGVIPSFVCISRAPLFG